MERIANNFANAFSVETRLIKSDHETLARTDILSLNQSDTFQLALVIAFFIIPIREVAISIALEAINLARIKNSEKESHRRRWLTGKKYKSSTGPIKALLHKNQLVQQYIWQIAEKYERFQEGESINIQELPNPNFNPQDQTQVNILKLLSESSLTEDDMIIRYLKTIVQYTNYNSEDLTTAVACLVGNMLPKDASLLHSLFKGVTPNYCSKRKLLLMNRLAERFHSYIRSGKADGKRTCFEGQQVARPNKATLVAKFFSLAIPWGTNCPEEREGSFSERFSQLMQKLMSRFRLRYIIDEDQKELAHAHTILCPNCIVQLFSELKFGCPRARVTIPNFFHEKIGAERSMGRDDNSLRLLKAEGIAINDHVIDYLDKEQSRREQVVITTLSIYSNFNQLEMCVNESSQYQLDLSQALSARFTINLIPQFLQITTSDEQGIFPIATLLPEPDKIISSWCYRLFGQSSINLLLANQDKLKFTFSSYESADNETQLSVQMQYQPYQRSVSQIKVLSGYLQYFKLDLNWTAITAIILIVIGTSWWLYRQSTDHQNNIAGINNQPINGVPITRGDRSNEKPDTNSKVVPPVSNPKHPAIVQFDLSITSNSTNASQQRILDIPVNAQTIELKLIVKEFQKYQQLFAIIETDQIQPEAIWRSEIVTTQPAAATDKMTITIPRRIFAAGNYRLKIEGKQSQTSRDIIESYRLVIKFANQPR